MPSKCLNLQPPIPVEDSCAQKQTNSSLLELTQSYLKARLENAAPDSMLAAAWDSFYEVYSGTVRRFVVAHGLRNVDADDCVQEVWMEVAERLPDFQHRDSRPGLRAWLYTVVRSKASDLLRRRGRQTAQSLEPLLGSSEEPAGDEAEPSSRLDQEWNVALVRTLMAQLRTQVSELNYRVLLLRFIKGRSVSEVAATLQITPEQVRYRQHRTLRKIRAMLGVYTGRAIGA
jgi:RNA polymerase sigma-70 factor (ECF subfamily)